MAHQLQAIILPPAQINASTDSGHWELRARQGPRPTPACRLHARVRLHAPRETQGKSPISETFCTEIAPAST